MANKPKAALFVFVLGMVGLAAAGCGSAKSNGTISGTAAPSVTTAATATTAQGATTASTAAPSGTTAPAASTNTVTVSETEFHLALSTTTFKPGSYTFVADNKGATAHALTIVGPGGVNSSTSTLQPGQSASLTVTLQAGSYELFCPIDSHKSLGMDTHITVGA